MRAVPDAPPLLLAVPNVSEGRDEAAIGRIGAAFVARGAARLLDTHSDPDHHRSVFTLAGRAGTLADALLDGAAQTLREVDLATPRGWHPHVGALDVVPVIHLHERARGAAAAEALVVADRLGAELELPVLLYGALGGGRTRAELRRGGPSRLAERLAAGELRPDFGPGRPHPTAGVALVGARPPLVAFNLELAPPADVETARRIAAAIREGGEEGLPSLRAIGLRLDGRGGTAQVSCNVEDPFALTLGAVVEAVARHAPIAAVELVGLAPRAALADLPPDVPMPGFVPARQILEEALRL